MLGFKDQLPSKSNQYQTSAEIFLLIFNHLPLNTIFENNTTLVHIYTEITLSLIKRKISNLTIGFYIYNSWNKDCVWTALLLWSAATFICKESNTDIFLWTAAIKNTVCTCRKSHYIEYSVQLVMVIRITSFDIFLSTMEYWFWC